MGWIKYFFDGTSYVATDDQIATGLVSWRNSRFEGLQRVDILHQDEVVMSLKGAGEFWQSDTMEVNFPEGSPRVVKRRVQKKLGSRDILYSIQEEHNILNIEVHYFMPLPQHKATIPIKGYNIGKWLTLEYNTDRGNKLYYLSDNRI